MGFDQEKKECSPHHDITARGYGEAARILETRYGVILPLSLRDEFDTFVSAYTGSSSSDAGPVEIWKLFEERYIFPQTSFLSTISSITDLDGKVVVRMAIETDGTQQFVEGESTTLQEAVIQAYRQHFGLDFTLEMIEERMVVRGAAAKILCFVNILSNEQSYFGVGLQEDLSRAFIMAVNAAVAQLYEDSAESSAEEERIREILCYIKSHYMHVTLDELSGVFYLSKTYLSRYIKEKSGLTFGDNLKNVRLQIAASLLKNKNMKIEQVANAAGYPNVEHFNRQFKKKYGCTPLQYRNA